MTNMAIQPKHHAIADDEDVSVEVTPHNNGANANVPPVVAMQPLSAPEVLVTPSWFAQNYPDQSSEDLAERYASEHPFSVAQPLPSTSPEAYEAYRRRLEERFKLAQKLADPAFAPLPPLPERPNGEIGSVFPQRVRRASTRDVALAAKSTHRLRWPQIAFLTLVACAIGGGGGFVVADPHGIKNLASGSAQAALAWFPSFAQSPQKVVSTDIAKKTIRSAQITVNDIAGSINTAIPLDITALSTDQTMPLAFKITGLPAEAYLTRGKQVTEGEWLLKAEDMAKAELVVPRSQAAELGLEVTAFDTKTGEIAAPSQQMHIALDLNAVPTPGVVPPPLSDKTDIKIVPVSAMPDSGFNKAVDVPTPMQSLNPEAISLMNKGEALLKSGDIIAARQFFLRAYELKVPEAAYGVGRTYDPGVFAEHKVRGLTPDPAKAAEWYGKSAVTGHPDSVTALERLGSIASP